MLWRHRQIHLRAFRHEYQYNRQWSYRDRHTNTLFQRESHEGGWGRKRSGCHVIGRRYRQFRHRWRCRSPNISSRQPILVDLQPIQHHRDRNRCLHRDLECIRPGRRPDRFSHRRQRVHHDAGFRHCGRRRLYRRLHRHGATLTADSSAVLAATLNGTSTTASVSLIAPTVPSILTCLPPPCCPAPRPPVPSPLTSLPLPAD